MIEKLESTLEAPAGIAAAEPPFREFSRIPRLSRGMVVTEKIDGTNAQIHITEDGRLYAGSRKRWLTPEADNYGFAAWVREHEADLRGLGPGTHFGEWWGLGIQRGYGLNEKRFSLFNVARWGDEAARPLCCDVVPVLYEGDFDTGIVDNLLEGLAREGSVAAPGFMRPEGIVVYHKAANALFKKTLDGNDTHKGDAAARAKEEKRAELRRRIEKLQRQLGEDA